MATVEQVHRLAVSDTVATIAQYLQETLGQCLVAYAIGVSDPKAVGKYAAGRHEPQTDTEARLRDLYRVTRLALVGGAACDGARLDDRIEPPTRRPSADRGAPQRRCPRGPQSRRGISQRRLARRWPPPCGPRPRGRVVACRAGPRPFAFQQPRGRFPHSHQPVLGGNRWDDPDGEFTTLYCSTTPEGAFAETIARYRTQLGLLERIDRFLTGEPDPAYYFPLAPGRVPDGYFTNSVLGHVAVDPDVRFVDVDHPPHPPPIPPPTPLGVHSAR